MATTQHRPHGAFAGPPYGTLDGKTPAPAAAVTTQHRPHGAFAGPRYGTLSGKGSSTAAVISAGNATITGSTTATVGCTTDTASGTLYALARTGGTPASDATIIATGQSAAVSSTTPSIAYTGLTAATAYTWDQVQVVSAVNSNVNSNATGTTDNPGGGGGGIPETVDATVGAYAWAGVAGAVGVATISGGVGAYAWAGISGSLGVPGTIDATPGAYSWSGVPATLSVPSISAGVGAFAWVGVAGSLGDIADAPLTGEQWQDMHTRLHELFRLHGLEAGQPLVVTSEARVAGELVQSMTAGSGSVTVTKTATFDPADFSALGGALADDSLAGDGSELQATDDTLTAAQWQQVSTWIEALHLIHGLRTGSPLVITETLRSAGAISQALAGTDRTTVERV